MKMRLPRPWIVVASIALFAALSGGAVATNIVPLARHAYRADTATNAQKLGGKTPAQLAASFRGARGPQGLQGVAGPAGQQGPVGPAGSQGGVGVAGPQGATGPQGLKGDVGAGLKIVGTVATVGALPTSGTTGDAYLVGGNLYVWTGSAWTNAGPVLGPKGDTGATGSTGAQGTQGPQGLKGDTGTTGSTGAQGPQGIPGAAAAKGDTGATGATGSQGPQGPSGPQGPQGPSGPQGLAGTAAVSVHTQAYSLTATGNAGSEGQFTATCSTGQKAVGGGFDSNGGVFNLDSAPTVADDGWTIYLVNPDSVGRSGTVYATCLG